MKKRRKSEIIVIIAVQSALTKGCIRRMIGAFISSNHMNFTQHFQFINWQFLFLKEGERKNSKIVLLENRLIS